MLWARQYGHATVHRFIDNVYAPFWKRELDVESEDVVARLLNDLDADGAAFTEWAHAQGLARNARLQTAAFEAGIYGVPTYVVGDELYFDGNTCRECAGSWADDPAPRPISPIPCLPRCRRSPSHPGG